jgi:polyisoprenyl-phosphate glycosyltransferase
VIPFHNEEEVLPLLKDRLCKLLGTIPCPTEVICINDGSRDRTFELLEEWAEKDGRIRVISLARNFGHQVAVTAGLDHTDPKSDAVVVMDADLQDPPEVILEMIAKYLEGYDVVYGQRVDREGETFFKKSTAWLFYRVMRWAIDPNLPVDTGDFRLMSRRSLEAFLSMRERHRFLRGMTTWVGFPQIGVRFTRPGRAAGSTKYSLRKMISLSWNAIISFSPLPLRVCFGIGLSVSAFGFIYTLYTLYHHFITKTTVPGWTALVVLQCFIGGAILIALGVVGEYIAKIFEEIKTRPLYIIQEKVNFPAWERKGPNKG